MGLASSLVVAATVTTSVAFPAVIDRWAPALLMVGFVLGLPHGAVDHLVPFWISGRTSAWQMLALLAGYLALAVATWAVLQGAAQVALPLMLLVSILHFGAGDLMTTSPAAGRNNWPPTRKVAHVIARGGPILAGPLVFWPRATSAAIFELDPGTVHTLHTLTWPIAIIVAACVVLDTTFSSRARDRRSAIDTMLIAMLFGLTPPTAAFGVYFGAWHGTRHTARLIESDPRNTADLAHHHYLRPLLRFLRSALIPSLVALGVVTALLLVTQNQTELTRPVFLLLFSLTIPHMVIVALMDRATSDVATRGPRHLPPPNDQPVI